MIRLPGKQVCYVSELNKKLPRPAKMREAFIKVRTTLIITADGGGMNVCT